MDIIPDKRKVVGLVENAHVGKICLPDFQRDFVWPRDQVADLLRSILRRYFIGSLLLLRCDPNDPPFAPIYLRGSKPQFTEPQPELLVLDGQQRLTALIYALTAPDLGLKDTKKRRWFFVDLNVLLDDPEKDEIVFERAKRELDGLDKPEVQYQRRILPCTKLLRSKDFHDWRDGLDDWIRGNEPDKHDEFRKELRPRLNEVINNFEEFPVPVVELPRVDDGDAGAIGRVCAIFEKLNSTGVELSVYDLLTARLYRSGIKLHDLWDQACGDNDKLAEWSDGDADNKKFGVLLLRTMALLRGLEVKPSVLINLKPQNFVEDWNRAAGAVDRALELLTMVGEDGFGVFDPRWIPGYGLLPTLGALRTEIEERGLGEEPRADLRRWYWCNLFLERYSSAVESKSRRDYLEFTTYWTAGTPEPSLFADARAIIGAPGYSIRNSASSSSSVYSGIFCLLALRGARDWRRGENIQLQELQDHHIFPQDYLKKRGMKKKEGRNTIVNRTLISDETNGKIKNKAPADYLGSTEIFPNGATQSLLSPHFLTPAAVIAMDKASAKLDDEKITSIYEEFLKERESAIVAEIRRVCGIES